MWVNKPDRIRFSVLLNDLYHHYGSNERSMKIIQTNVSYLRNCTFWKFSWCPVWIKCSLGGNQYSSVGCVHFVKSVSGTSGLLLRCHPVLLPFSWNRPPFSNRTCSLRELYPMSNIVPQHQLPICDYHQRLPRSLSLLAYSWCFPLLFVHSRRLKFCLHASKCLCASLAKTKKWILRTSLPWGVSDLVRITTFLD